MGAVQVGVVCRCGCAFVNLFAKFNSFGRTKPDDALNARTMNVKGRSFLYIYFSFCNNTSFPMLNKGA